MKQTEIGLIPDDWEVKEFKQEATLINGRAYAQSELLKQGKYKVLRVGNFGTNDTWYYSNLELPEKQYCTKGDLLYCWSCTYGAYIWNEPNTIYHYHIWKIISKGADKEYLKYILNNDTENQMKSSNGSTMAHITKGFLENRLFVFPPLPEQRRIAKALSDVDTFISTTEKLIQKKKNIKLGTMQNLLTGKKRLPGFGPQTKSPSYKQTELGLIPEDWEVIQVKDNYFLKGRIGWQGLKASEFIDRGPYLVTGTDFENGKVNWDTCYHISEKRYAEDKALHVKKDDLLITKDGTVGKVAYIDQKPEKVSLNSHLLIIRPLKDILINRYLYYILSSKYFFDYYQQTQTGTTMASLSQDKISKFMYPLPPKEEQNAIANVLSCMDKEIETLNTKLEKYRNLKTSMMQQLLTGKIRLG